MAATAARSVAAGCEPPQRREHGGQLPRLAVPELREHACIPLVVRDVDDLDLVLLGVELVGKRVRVAEPIQQLRAPSEQSVARYRGCGRSTHVRGYCIVHADASA